MPGRQADEAEKKFREEFAKEARNRDSDRAAEQPDPRLVRKARSRSYDEEQAAFFEEADAFLLRLQHLGRVKDATDQGLDFKSPSELPGTDLKFVHPFGFANNPSVSFTLWWQDKAENGVLNSRQDHPDPTDLRVRVQAQNHQDHVSVIIVIDCGQPWSGDPYTLGSIPPGRRRSDIFRRLLAVQNMAESQIRSGAVDSPIDREEGISEEVAAGLLETTEYLYNEIWDEFLEAFGVTTRRVTSDTKGIHGEIFAETRGLVLPSAGLTTQNGIARTQANKALKASAIVTPTAAKASPATIGIGKFDVFDNEAGEPNTVIKSHWPFIRRISVDADQRDFVACGILDWRALYISPLGSSGRQHPREERDGPRGVAPANYLPEYGPSHDGRFVSKPTRFLFLTKGEPHKRQIGRFIERVCAIETMRLFALKNWRTVQNAAVHIRLLGRELDGVLTDWGQRRAEIDKIFNPVINRWREEEERKITANRILKLPEWPTSSSAPPDVQIYIDARAARLTTLISNTEEKIISLGSALDYIGQKGSGRLINLIDRSSQFISEFKRMTKTLEVGNIDTWINYDQFVSRGVDPLFDQIANTGRRLDLFRERLQSISQVVQTSALIVEADGTKSNTQILRRLADTELRYRFGFWALILAALIALATLFQAGIKMVQLSCTQEWHVKQDSDLCKSVFLLETGLPTKE